MKRLGKTPIVVKNSPGFVVNRILCPMLNEAIFALQEDLASAQAIDDGMKLGCNHPIGPLALADMIGLDVLLAVMNVFYADFNDPKYRAAPLLREMVAAGWLGRKSRQGLLRVSGEVRRANGGDQAIGVGPGCTERDGSLSRIARMTRSPRVAHASRWRRARTAGSHIDRLTAPPSISRFWPTMKPASALHRNAQALPNSSGVPKRPAGTSARRAAAKVATSTADLGRALREPVERARRSRTAPAAGC